MIKIVCKRCSFELYRGKEPVSILEVYRKWDGRCPRCLRKLGTKPAAVTIK